VKKHFHPGNNKNRAWRKGDVFPYSARDERTFGRPHKAFHFRARGRGGRDQGREDSRGQKQAKTEARSNTRAYRRVHSLEELLGSWEIGNHPHKDSGRVGGGTGGGGTLLPGKNPPILECSEAQTWILHLKKGGRKQQKNMSVGKGTTRGGGINGSGNYLS